MNSKLTDLLNGDKTSEEEEFFSELFHGELWGDLPIKVRELFDVTIIEHYGGEGKGDLYYTIACFTSKETKEETFVKFNGWYESYNGAEYEGWAFVTPRIQTKVVYE